MARKASEIIGSIHSKTKPVNQSKQDSLTQPIIIGGASKMQTKAFEKMACALTDLADGTGGVPTSRSITGVNSIQGGGDLTADRTIQLVGDELNPGTNQYYGTDGAGAKGYHDLPGAGSGTDLGIVGRTDETLNISSSTGADATVPAATEFLAGLMTAQDKTKIDGVDTGAEANVQADWNEADIGSDAYIKNKPSIPTDTGITYSLSDGTPVVATVGDRGVASTLTGADKAYETSQTIDPLTGNTIDQTFEGGNVDFIDTVITNEDSTINNVNTVTNNDADSAINNNGNTITNTSTTTDNIDVTESYDNTSVTNNNGNTTNNTDTTTNNLGDEIVNLDEDATITNNFDGDINNNYSDTYEENNTYVEGATINNTGEVINNNTNYTETNNNTNTTVNNIGGTVNNEGTTNNYDENSTVNYEGDIYIGGDIINTYNDMNNGAVSVEVGPGVSWTDIANVLSCDGSVAVSTPISPVGLDSVRLVVNDIISGDTKSNGVTSGASAIYGGGADVRGLPLTPADVMDADFGAVFKFGDSAYVKVTGFNFSIPNTNTILGVKVNVTFTSTPISVSVDCITMTLYHTDNSEFTSGVDVYEAGVLKVAAATTIDFNSNAIVTDMGGGVARVDITGGSGSGGAIATDHLSMTYNGTDLDWQLPTTPLTEESVHLTTDSGTNLILDVDYSVSVDTIIWIVAPATGETINASWIKASGTNITEITEQFLGDGLTDTFTLAQTYLTDAKIYLNGLRQFSTNYAVLGTSLVFSTIPALNDEIIIDYKF